MLLGSYLDVGQVVLGALVVILGIQTLRLIWSLR